MLAQYSVLNRDQPMLSTTVGRAMMIVNLDEIQTSLGQDGKEQVLHEEPELSGMIIAVKLQEKVRICLDLGINVGLMIRLAHLVPN